MKDGQAVENLDPGRQDISDSLKQVLSSLSNIINGLAAMKNRMPDAHGVAYKPRRHHAKLAVNPAKTHADFIFGVCLTRWRPRTIALTDEWAVSLSGTNFCFGSIAPVDRPRLNARSQSVADIQPGAPGQLRSRNTSCAQRKPLFNQQCSCVHNIQIA